MNTRAKTKSLLESLLEESLGEPLTSCSSKSADEFSQEHNIGLHDPRFWHAYYEDAQNEVLQDAQRRAEEAGFRSLTFSLDQDYPTERDSDQGSAYAYVHFKVSGDPSEVSAFEGSYEKLD